MSEGFGKHVAGKIVGAVLVVAGICVIIWYFRMDDAQRAAIWSTVRGVLLWIGLVGALPWATFFVPARIIRVDSNLASGLMLAGYALADAGIALLLIGGWPSGTWRWAGVILGLLVAAVYNLVVCEYLASRAEDAA